MGIPTWTADNTGLFDPNRIIDDVLPEPYVVTYSDSDITGRPKSILAPVLGQATVVMNVGYRQFEVIMTHFRTHALAMIDRIE